MKINWWNDRIIYQIYPRSFCDSNGDGIGDINGIISKLPYLKDLGVGAIWLSPVYPSPNHDFGYDIADYCDVNPEYGTLDDMKRLIKEAEKLDIKIIMDLVINHTSYKHPYFEASKDPNSKYHNYYVWKKGRTTKKGKKLPPNNWLSFFTGPAWTYEASNDMWYLHLFTKEQPDLNYENQEVIDEVKRIMTFWLELGVAGFRCDVINIIYKSSYENGKFSVYKRGLEHYLSQPRCHEILHELHVDVLSKYNAFTVGETTDVTLEAAKTFTENDELTTVFPFDHTSIDYFLLPVFKRKYRPKKMIKAMQKWQENIPWNSVFIENHDIPRALSRFGDVKNPVISGSAIAAMVLTLRGTPYIYQGQEIGMTNYPFTNIDEIQDIATRNVYFLLRKLGFCKKKSIKLINNFARDHARTPMQWNNTENAGFSTTKPWLNVNRNYATVNVEQELIEEKSLLNEYKKIIQVRKDYDALRYGSIKFLNVNKNVMSFERDFEKQKLLVVINLSKKEQKIKLDLDGEIIYHNYENLIDGNKLRPYEVQIIKK
ncbi:MAG: glycoside hydrolase family 13 protein [Bacilli bacterium]|jgi:oligo-1,6-glucosidase